MDLKIDLKFAQAKESKYRRNAVLQIRQEVENVLKHAKLDKEDTGKNAEEEKETGRKSCRPKEKEIRKPSRKRNSMEITAAASAGIPTLT